MVSPTLAGMLAGAESFGALLGGLWLTSGDPPLSGRTLMVGGSLLFLVCVILMPLAPVFSAGLRAAGRPAAFGSAAFANMQTSLIVLHAPPHIRSRLMGLLTVCIGMGPLGILLIGALAERLGPLVAVDIIDTDRPGRSGCIGLVWRRNELRQPAAMVTDWPRRTDRAWNLRCCANLAERNKEDDLPCKTSA